MFDRESFIKSVPKPKNEEVIVYDTTLKDLIDKDVLVSYEKLYPVFISKKNEYITLRGEIETSQKMVDNVFLYNPAWDIEDYLRALQNDKRTYATLYSEIKKDESAIEVIKKKIEGMDEKIKIQQVKEQKKLEENKSNAQSDIEDSKESLARLKQHLSTYQDSMLQIDRAIQDNEEDFKLLSLMQDEIQFGDYRCVYCGCKVKVKNEDAPIFKRLLRNLEKNKEELTKLLAKKEKLEIEIAYYEHEIEIVKEKLSNAISYSKNNKSEYTKKSLAVLKLEAMKDELMSKQKEATERIESNHKVSSDSYQKLKNRISLYEQSIQNLNKMTEVREEISKKIEKYKKLEEELKPMLKTINEYIKFIELYYKIIEQKLGDFFGTYYKFKFAKIEDYKLIKMFDIYYKGIEYSQLSVADKKVVNKDVIGKISIYS